MEECEQQLKGSDVLFFLAKVWIEIQPLMFRQFLLQVGDKCHHSSATLYLHSVKMPWCWTFKLLFLGRPG
jgi:hypothetical protein